MCANSARTSSILAKKIMGAMSALLHHCLDATSRHYPISARLLFHINSINAMGLGVYVQQEKKQILDDI
jgi:hypothetical protein